MSELKIIGIDPDIESPGVCHMLDGEINGLESTAMCHLLEDVPMYVNKGYIFAVENVEAKKTTFKRKGVSALAHAKIAQDVGRVKGAARVLIQYIKHHGGKVILVPAGVGSKTKNDAKLFKELTGYQGRTNEDKRDAWAIADWAHNKIKSGAI